MSNNDAINVLKLDHALIGEALRRLTDGTCCLKGEERDYIHELFEKANQAVRDHIVIEEEVYLPRVAVESAVLMRHEHARLAQILVEARHAIFEERALTFKLLIEALKTSLNDHEKIERQLFETLSPNEIDHQAMLSVQRRVSKNIV